MRALNSKADWIWNVVDDDDDNDDDAACIIFAQKKNHGQSFGRIFDLF